MARYVLTKIEECPGCEKGIQRVPCSEASVKCETCGGNWQQTTPVDLSEALAEMGFVVYKPEAPAFRSRNGSPAERFYSRRRQWFWNQLRGASARR